jgi:glyoxylase-like metal-dependent hydrolase (beta-lactamase superfamily II)
MFYRKVGHTDLQNSSAEDQFRFMRRLYNLLPDSTEVYPGHEQYT